MKNADYGRRTARRSHATWAAGRRCLLACLALAVIGLALGVGLLVSADRQESENTNNVTLATPISETTPAAPPRPPPPSPPPPAWDDRLMAATHYWDCNGQGCDATTLQPWKEGAAYVSPPGYGPQDPADHGGAAYGERMWLLGAASDSLAAMLGDDDPCCGRTPIPSGCGNCLLVQNPDAVNAGWTAVVMKKNRCPPWTNGCGDGELHVDIAAPGFDFLPASTANVCSERAGTGFDNQEQSELLGRWWESCADTRQCAVLCDQLPAPFVAGCRLFTSWGWTRGDPSRLRFRKVACPDAFRAHVSAQFGPEGPVLQASPPPSPAPPPPPPTSPLPSMPPPPSPAPSPPPPHPCGASVVVQQNYSYWLDGSGGDCTCAPGGEALTCSTNQQVVGDGGALARQTALVSTDQHVSDLPPASAVTGELLGVAHPTHGLSPTPLNTDLFVGSSFSSTPTDCLCLRSCNIRATMEDGLFQRGSNGAVLEYDMTCNINPGCGCGCSASANQLTLCRAPA